MTDTYARLLERLKRLHLISSVGGLLGWDEQVNLPRNSAGFRADQMALMASLEHEAASDSEVGGLLAELEANSGELDADQAIVVREARKKFDRVTKLPAEFVAEKARHSSAAYHAWTEARSKRDYASYAPFIAKHLDLAQREAEYQGWGDRSYDYAIDLHDPGFSAKKIDGLFSELKTGLVPLVRQIDEAAAGQGESPFLGFPVDAQRKFLHEVTAKLGFDYDRGRIDVSPHPFCEGSGADVRMTTRFHEDEPLDSLFSSIHETGHGLYEQGLQMEHHHTALGQHAGMAMHESQSRMWENQVGRSRAFWTHFEPRFRELFGVQLGEVSSDRLYREINAVRPTLIRVDSDEVHYNLHIILRFESEKALFAGDLEVDELPQVWNDRSEAMLGIRPQHDGEGVLQDVHWSGGAFGYFPSYCLGNMIAAQNWVAVRQQIPDLEGDFAEGRFERLLSWLQTQIHSQGSRTSALDRVKTVTGQPLSPQPLLAYLNDRYGSLYR